MILMLIVPTEVSLPLGLGYTEVPGLRNNRLCTQPVCMVEGCWKDAKSKEDTKVCASEESFWMKRSRSGGKHTGSPPKWRACPRPDADEEIICDSKEPTKLPASRSNS